MSSFAPIYSISKTALNAVTLQYAQALGNRGIPVNAVCPGWVDTPMLAQSAGEEELEVEDFLEMAAEESPNGRIATPEEVAALILFLAGDTATHITGTAIPIDGGLTA